MPTPSTLSSPPDVQPDRRPLIVTARMDAAAQAMFNALRTVHFPAGRNWLSAHVTLFHALPALERPAIETALMAEAEDHAPPDVAVSGLRFLGNGVAYGLECAALTALRDRLARRFDPWLTRQDRQGFRPHVTIQNKVAAAAARALHADLSGTFSPWSFAATGLDLWHYDGGPWAPAAGFGFRAA